MNRLILFASAITRIPVRIIRFLISGGTAALTELVLLYIFTDWVGLWYELSLVIAFLITFCVSFTLQKFWTFEDHSTEGVHMQASVYLFVSLINFAINAIALYVFVQYLHIWYILSQIIINAIIAMGSFVIYRSIIFKPKVVQSENPAA